MSLKDLETYKWGTRRIIILLVASVVAAAIAYAWGGRLKSEHTATLSADDGIPNNGKNCAALEVSSIDVSAQYPKEGTPFDAPPTITIGPGVAGKPLTITALGPVLGSMDSTRVKTHLVCTAKGFAVTATLTRSADYHGGSAKNVLWRPRIEMAVVLREPEAIFEVTWKLRQTTGNELNHAQTPPYPEQRYPITLTKTLTRN